MKTIIYNFNLNVIANQRVGNGDGVKQSPNSNKIAMLHQPHKPALNPDACLAVDSLQPSATLQ